MKSLFICFAALFMMIATPWVFKSIDNTLSQEQTQTFAGVTTAAGEYASNVTLGFALWNDTAASVNTMTSNITGSDVPAAYDYNSVSHILTVSGLEESQTRTLSINFSIDSTTLPDFFDTFLMLFRWFWVFIIIGMAGGAIYAFFVS